MPPSAHGIDNNTLVDPDGRSNGAWYWYARDIKVPTLPGLLRASGHTTAAVSWPVTVGMELDYNVPEHFRSRHPEALSLLRREWAETDGGPMFQREIATATRRLRPGAAAPRSFRQPARRRRRRVSA